MAYSSCTYLECHCVATNSLGPSVFVGAFGIVLVDDWSIDPETLAHPGHGKNDVATFKHESPVVVVRSEEYMRSMMKSHCGSDYVASSDEPLDTW